MQGAIFNGLFNIGAPFDFFCPSGNCTWPDFSSLAMCNTCKNVSNETIKVENGNNLTFETPGGTKVKMAKYHSNQQSYDLVGGAYQNRQNIAIVQAEGEGVGFYWDSSIYYYPVSNWTLSYRVTECNITGCVKLYKDIRVVCISPI